MQHYKYNFATALNYNINTCFAGYRIGNPYERSQRTQKLRSTTLDRKETTLLQEAQ